MAHKPKISIKSVLFSGGQTINFTPGEAIIFVGPNNSGKSATLREINAIITEPDSASRFESNHVIKSIAIEKTGDAETLKRFLKENAEYRNGNFYYFNLQISDHHVGTFSGKYCGLSGKLFCKFIGAETRLTITHTQKSIALGSPKSKPQHVLYDDESIMRRVSDLFKMAFSESLMIDFRGGSEIPIHVGAIPNGLQDRVSDEYVQNIRMNPNLERQGDGMRSYAGILFEIVVTNYDIYLVDEPEAFLHPPQMRRIGQTLSEHASGQILVATHSADILRGFLDGKRDNIRVIRLQREKNLNIATETTPDEIRLLWERPELRYSNALDALFHEQVVICEDHSDCRLYNAMADHLEKSNPDLTWPDTVYIPSGGKHTIPKIASALYKMGVPVKVVLDMDFLSEGDLVKSCIESLGGKWHDIEDHWRRLDAEVRKGVKVKSHKEISQSIVSLLQDVDHESLPKSEIKELLQSDKSWSLLKRFGEDGLPHGQARTIFENLNRALKRLNIFVVPVGQPENFCPDIGSHGPRFVARLLNTVPLEDPKLEFLRKFVLLLRG